MSDEDRLDETVVYEILSSERRRHTIDYLRANEDGVEVNDIAEYIARKETGESPPPKDARKTVYVSLHQTHLPKMDDLDILNYDTDTKEVTLSDSFRDVAVYMEVVPGTEISWSEYYLAVGLVGLATVFAHTTGAPLIADIGVEYWAVLYLLVVSASALYQTFTRRLL
ncbi:MAG: hypothetical protein ACI9QA_000253 [Methanobacteriota archaeon]|jgi:hypothetical protein|uniref:DUF7344 domain-containing protein n=1 Tax=Halorutilus salinus TaxID=2487751 RepID=A0A9Q4C2M3_9EURY|nr:hypothetical protein [Halorutilus salinus]MCX2818173.1 hypothetical protein [Halorutilus salinus]